MIKLHVRYDGSWRPGGPHDTTPSLDDVSDGFSSYQVALEADELYAGGDGTIRAPALGFNGVHQVSAELIASFQNTQNHQVIMTHVLQDVSG